MADDLDLLEGDWTVKVQGWVWTYTFSSGGGLTWQDTRSPEKGSGSWTANGKSVNLSWNDGNTRESWLRPLTASTNKTWYESSYFRGSYRVEKKTAATAPSTAAAHILDKPPDVRQRALYCWAAGASSWLRARGRGNLTVDQLVEKYGGYLNRDGSMPEGNSDDPDALKGGLKQVFNQIGIQVASVAVKELTYEYFLNKLKTNGHVLLMAQYGADMGHTYVVYGVGAPSSEYFSVFDPMHGYENKKFSEIRGSSAYVGWAK